MELKAEIQLLIQLQKLDSEIFLLKRRKGDIPILIKKLEEDFKTEESKLKEVEGDYKSLHVRNKDKENDLAAKEETIKKYQVQLYQIKTNKEYTALQQEINKIKADKSALEDEIIVLLDEVDSYKKKMDEAKVQLKEKENKLNSDKKKFDEEMKEIELRLSQLESNRKELVGKADKNILSKYERILYGKDGLALVRVSDEACGGCHLNLPPQVIHEIKMMKDLIFCESCARILYIEE